MVASSIGMNLEEVIVVLEIMSNIKSLIAAICDICKSNNGAMNMDAQAFVTAISMSVCQTPPTGYTFLCTKSLASCITPALTL